MGETNILIEIVVSLLLKHSFTSESNLPGAFVDRKGKLSHFEIFTTAWTLQFFNKNLAPWLRKTQP